ncbi:hypothetical protein CFter6_2149 [Collimonas fungivorans]|uniref:Uncharacterized protein n=1 Tax=Collimonas fungivorans TaxID=158899 RepID=A0A127PAR0_9BURK|nr:hypothetical protein CFter6_2149 [Collimonas fungivorans]
MKNFFRKTQHCFVKSCLRENKKKATKWGSTPYPTKVVEKYRR